MTPTPQWYEADDDDADRHPNNAQEGTSGARMAVAGTPGATECCEALRGRLRLRTEALGRVQRERDELAAEVERLRGIVNSQKMAGRAGPFNPKRSIGRHANALLAAQQELAARAEAAEADNARLRETLARVGVAAGSLIQMLEDAYEETCTPSRGCIGCELLLKAANLRAALSARAADQPARNQPKETP